MIGSNEPAHFDTARAHARACARAHIAHRTLESPHQVRERDLFGRWASRWRVIRTSNAYVFRDPQQRPAGVFASKSENPSGTGNQEILDPVLAPPGNPNSPLEHALQQLSGAIKARLLMNKDGGIGGGGRRHDHRASTLLERRAASRFLIRHSTGCRWRRRGRRRGHGVNRPAMPDAVALARLEADMVGKVLALAADPRDALASALARLGRAFMARDS